MNDNPLVDKEDYFLSEEGITLKNLDGDIFKLTQLLK